MTYSIIIFVLGIFVLFLLSESVRKERKFDNELKRSGKTTKSTKSKKGKL